MVEVTIKFTGETHADVRYDVTNALKAGLYLLTLQDVRNEIFRPARKHGYPDTELRLLCENENVRRAIALLEAKFTEIVNEREVDA